MSGKKTTTEKTTSLLGQGQKAQFLNMQKDGIKIRSATFKNKRAYNRKDKSWKQD